MRLADEAVVIDNAGSRPERVLALDSGQLTWTATPLPAWVLDLARRLGEYRLPA